MTERRMPRVVKAVTACSKMDNEILTYFRFILECGHTGATGKWTEIGDDMFCAVCSFDLLDQQTGTINDNERKARSAIKAWRDIGLKHSTDNEAGVKWILLVHVLGIVESALDGTAPRADTKPCSICGKLADSIGLEDGKLYCTNCTFIDTAPHQPFEWLSPTPWE